MMSNRHRNSGFSLLAFVVCAVAVSTDAQVIDVDIAPSHVRNSFIPNQTLGAGIDRIPQTVIDSWTTIGELIVLLWHTEIEDTEVYLVGSYVMQGFLTDIL